MSKLQDMEKAAREPLLHPVDRVSEMIFGLFMALTFVGVVSVTSAGRDKIRDMLIAALGCNLAWGMVDAIMYLIRTITERARILTLARSVMSADAETGRRIIRNAMSTPAAKLLSIAEIEAVRGRVLAMTNLPAHPEFKREDLLAAFAIFVIVVASTFPVGLPFIFFDDPVIALTVCYSIAVAMLFFAGLVLGRYAGYGSWKTGVLMAGIGLLVVAVVIVLGG